MVVKMLNFDYDLYLITDRRQLGNRTLLQAVQEAFDGGVRVIQLREKDMSEGAFLCLTIFYKELYIYTE